MHWIRRLFVEKGFFMEPRRKQFLITLPTRLFRNDPQAQDIAQRLAESQAGDVMSTDVITILEKALIEDAIRLMTEKILKMLTVVDAAGCFLGLIRRESLGRSGFSIWNSFAGTKK